MRSILSCVSFALCIPSPHPQLGHWVGPLRDCCLLDLFQNPVAPLNADNHPTTRPVSPDPLLTFCCISWVWVLNVSNTETYLSNDTFPLIWKWDRLWKSVQWCDWKHKALMLHKELKCNRSCTGRLTSFSPRLLLPSCLRVCSASALLFWFMWTTNYLEAVRIWTFSFSPLMILHILQVGKLNTSLQLVLNLPSLTCTFPPNFGILIVRKKSA